MTTEQLDALTAALSAFDGYYNNEALQTVLTLVPQLIQEERERTKHHTGSEEAASLLEMVWRLLAVNASGQAYDNLANTGGCTE